MSRYAITGQHNLITEGVRALDVLEEAVRGMFARGAEVAEIEIYENMPIRALVVEDAGTTYIEWTGRSWVEA